MRYVYLELVGYNRIPLNGTRRFSIAPTERIQLILGTNGSGKSSMIAEMSPLPANASDFSKDGSKTIKIVNKGNNYTLRSVFSPKTSHSFECNGEELNPSGTASVQRELVWQHFHITQEIHDLLTDVERFSSMSPARRREWCTTLADSNYDYALSMFAKFKEKYRDVSGALKLAKKRLVTETEKAITPEEEEKLKRDVVELQAQLEQYQALRAPIEKTTEEHVFEYGLVAERIQQLSSDLLRRRTRMYDLSSYGSMEVVDQAIERVAHDITANNTLLNKYVADHAKLTETLSILKRTGVDGLKSLEAKRKALTTEINAKLDQRVISLEWPEHSESKLSALETIRETLQYIASEIPDNSDRRFTQATLQAITEQRANALMRVDELRQSLEQSRLMRTHMEAHKDQGQSVCPKCSHAWNANFNERKHQGLIEEIEKKALQLKEAEAVLEKVNEEVALFDNYRKHYGDFNRLQQSWPILSDLWTHISNTGYLLNAPRLIPMEYEKYHRDILIEIEALQIDKQIQEVGSLIIQAEKVGDAEATDVMDQLGICTNQIESITQLVTNLRHSQNVMQEDRRYLQGIINTGAEVEKLVKNLEGIAYDIVDTKRKEMINQTISRLTILLGRKTEALSEIKMQRVVIADITANIAQLTVEEETWKILVKELSPTEGLIADGLLGFIRTFTAKMNSMIHRVWAYPLQVMPCGISGDRGAELDYKFPLMVQSRENTVPDVSKGSRGMQEIVNISFKIVAMTYLGIADSPLFLDEFASSMDPGHKVAASNMVRTIMDQQSFSQLFMISHDYHQYGSFNTRQVCVMSEMNTILPDSYNEHVTIE